MTKTIEDILKELPLDADVKASLQESWNAALADAKVAQEAQVKEELSTRYENDIEKIHEAFGMFLEERIKPHVEELQEGVESVEAMKSSYAAKTAKIAEAAKAHVKRRLGAIEKVVEQRVRSELNELHEDVVANRRAALQAVAESKAALESDRTKFRAKAAKVMEHILNVKVPAQLDELREDIEAAKKDNFGREIFEAFSMMYRRQFFDTSSEFKKLSEQVEAANTERDQIKVKAAKAVRESREEATASKRALNKLNESVTRRQTMARLLKPLSGTPRVQMKALLEATKTEKLESTFRKEMPRMVKEAKRSAAPAKKRLNEGKTVKAVEFRSGGTAQLNESDYDEFDDQIADIRRLAGN